MPPAGSGGSVPDVAVGSAPGSARVSRVNANPARTFGVSPKQSFLGERTRPRVLFSPPRRNAFLFNQRESLARRQRQHARARAFPESFARHAPKPESEQE